MPVPIIAIAEALRLAIETALTISIDRRYSAYFNREDVATGKYLMVLASEETQAKRGIDLLELSIDIGYQIALPAPTPTYPDPANNLPWIDAQLALVDAIKQLFRPDGALRDKPFAGATWIRQTNTPLYRPDTIRDNEIFTSVIRFDFRTEVD